MEVEIIDRKENNLVKRTELRIRILHPGEATPKREDVRKKVAAIVGVKEELVVLRKIISSFGKAVSYGLVHVYNSREDIFKWEPKYILRRNKMVE